VGYSIITFDEAGLRLVPVYRRVWYTKGERPEGVFFWSNKRINIFGALINGRDFYYQFYESMNTLTYLIFLWNFINQLPEGNYVFLFDNASYHKSSMIRKFLNRFNNIIVEFFPPYSPELNPTETCWKIIRHDVTNSRHFDTIDEMCSSVREFLSNHSFTLTVSNYLCR